MGRDNLVVIATRYGLDDRGDQILVEARHSAPVQTGPRINPATCTMGTGSFLGVKRPGRGVDHPPPSSADVKERVELYLYCPLRLRDLIWGKLYLYVYCTISNFKTQYEFYQIPKKCLILRAAHDMTCRLTKICSFYLSHVRYDKNFTSRKLSTTIYTCVGRVAQSV